MNDQCPALLQGSDEDEWVEQCTLELGHEGMHQVENPYTIPVSVMRWNGTYVPV